MTIQSVNSNALFELSTILMNSKGDIIMTIRNIIVSSFILLFAQGVMATQQEASIVAHQSKQTLQNLQSWDNATLKAFLSKRLSDNQHLLHFLSEHHDQITPQKMDPSFNSAVNTLLADQKALIFISENLSSIDNQEKLKLDAFMQENKNLSVEINQAISNNLEEKNGKNIVHRVLYYSLMEKYASK